MRLISSVFVLLLCSLQASAQAVSPLDESQIPVVVSGSSPIFDTVILSLIDGLKAFHDSPAFMTVMYLLFALCMVVGITWKAIGLMYGDGELGQLLLWGFMRFCLGFGLFFMSLHLTFLLVGMQNALAKGFLDASKSLRPADSEYAGLMVGMEAAVREFDARAYDTVNAVDRAFGKDVSKLMGTYTDWMSRKGLDPEFYATAKGSYLYGFPLVNYGLSLAYPKSFGLSLMVDRGVLTPGSKVSYRMHTPEPLYAGAAYPVPFQGFNDYWSSYNTSSKYIEDSRIDSSVQTRFAYRPLMYAIPSLRSHVLNRAKSFGVSSSRADVMRFVEIELPVYYSILDKIVKTYLADYVTFKAGFGSDWLVLSNLSGKDAVFGALLHKDDRPMAATVGEEMFAVLADLEKKVADYKADTAKTFDPGRILGLVVSFSLAVVSFYVAISVWSLPILLKIWESFYWLPEQFEFSGALKKGAKYVMILAAIPVFSVLVVQIALAFSEAIDNQMLAYGEATIADSTASGVSGFFLHYLDVAVSPLKNAGVGLLWIALRFAVWIFTALFIMGLPKILSGIITGAGGLAEGLVAKVGMAAAGGAFAARMMTTGAMAAPAVAGGVVRTGAAGAVATAALLKKLTD